MRQTEPYDEQASIVINRTHHNEVDNYDAFKNNHLIVGTDYYWHLHPDGSWVTTDGGKSWTKYNDWILQNSSLNTLGENTTNFVQPPSDPDLSNAEENGRKRNFVISVIDHKVYFFTDQTKQNNKNFEGSFKTESFYDVKEGVHK